MFRVEHLYVYFKAGTDAMKCAVPAYNIYAGSRPGEGAHFYVVHIYSANPEAISDGLHPLTMSHTASVISYAATGRARRAPQTET